MTYCSLIKAGGKVYLSADKKNNCIMGFESETEGLRYYEDGYNRKHGESYEGSMSACINHITFQPSIIKAPDKSVLSEWLGKEPRMLQIRNISGMIHGVAFAGEKVGETAWETGIKPRLI